MDLDTCLGKALTGVYACANGFFTERIAYTLCLYILLILGSARMIKKGKLFRFNDELYGEFKQICDLSNFTLTEAFERFMVGCVGSRSFGFSRKNRL